jgi:hypothetical protein
LFRAGFILHDAFEEQIFAPLDIKLSHVPVSFPSINYEYSLTVMFIRAHLKDYFKMN